MSIEEFKEQLTRYGIDWSIVNGKICVPCPREHQNLKPGQRPNVLLGMATDSGECGFCGEQFHSSDLLAAYVAEHEKRKTIKAVAKGNQPFKVWSVGEILNYEFGEDEWLAKDIIPLPGIAALSGMPGDYKTWLTIHIALSVARGIPAFEQFETKQGGVLIIDEENHLKHIKKRLTLLGTKADDPIYYLSMTGFKADREEKLQQILKMVKEKSIKLVIIDSLIRIHDKDENDASQMAKVFNGLQEIINGGASILFTHHHRKQTDFRPNNPAQSLRGSSDISAALDSHISVERKKNEDALILRQPKLRQAEPLKAFEIRILKDNDGGPCGFEYIGPHDEGKNKAEEAADSIENILADGSIKTTAEINKSLSGTFGKGAIRGGIKLAQNERHSIEQISKEELPEGYSTKGGKHYYRAAKTSSSDSPTFPLL